jgi:hypothetical protein
MADILATTGGRLFTKGLAGQAADAGPQVLDTVYNEATTGGLDSSTGLLDFGVACKVGSGTSAAGRLNVAPIETTDTAATVAGITSRLPNVKSANPSDNVTGWPSKHSVSIVRIGRRFAIPCENVRENDQVFAISASKGQLGGSTVAGAGSGRLIVKGAVWETTTAAGAVGIIKISDRGTPVLYS